ncbi:MAG: nucleotidyltransferase domain-containing protein [Chloroflexota bacterium]
MQSTPEVRERYQAALNALTEKLEQDRYILAAIVYGSAARGEAWEKSDIDLEIIEQDGLGRNSRGLWLVEEGINISAHIYSRSEFKRLVDGALQGSVSHSIRSHAKVLFCKDESIEAWFNESDEIGERDKEFQLLRCGAGIPSLLDKCEKWLYAKDDPEYSFVWIMYVVNGLARIEVVMNGEAPGREVIHQALRYNPTFFKAVYTDLIHGPKDRDTIEKALDLLNGYMRERAQVVFKPILDYLNEADGIRTATEMNEFFRKKVSGEDIFGPPDLFWAYEWLARHNIVEKISSPIRLTKKSQVTMEEPAFFYDDEEFDWE